MYTIYGLFMFNNNNEKHFNFFGLLFCILKINLNSVQLVKKKKLSKDTEGKSTEM